MKYNYAELREKAINGTEEDVNNLGEWFKKYGFKFWNGEGYITDDFKLYPIYKKGDQCLYELVGYKLII